MQFYTIDCGTCRPLIVTLKIEQAVDKLTARMICYAVHEFFVIGSMVRSPARRTSGNHGLPQSALMISSRSHFGPVSVGDLARAFGSTSRRSVATGATGQ